MENTAMEVAAVWFMIVFGWALLAQVYDFAKRCWK